MRQNLVIKHELTLIFREGFEVVYVTQRSGEAFLLNVQIEM